MEATELGQRIFSVTAGLRRVYMSDNFEESPRRPAGAAEIDHRVV